MWLEICKDQSDWLNFANEWLSSNIINFKANSLYVPAGETPRPLYGHWEQHKPSFLKNIRFVQIDDVATGPQKNLFKTFFLKELPSYQKQFSFFENGEDQAQLALLGLGLNGHVAFHEPGIPQHFYSGCVRLSETTIFNLNLKQKNTWGKTYGVNAFMKTKAILFLVRGENKRQILQKLLDPQNKSLPASALIEHGNCTVLCDFDV